MQPHFAAQAWPLQIAGNVIQSTSFRTIAGMIAASAALSVLPALCAAQMPTVPVLQNGFASRGMTLALNYGSGTGSDAYALAAGWSPASQRFQISGAVGGVRPDTGGTWTGYGARFAVPLYSGMADRFGVAVFGGVGGARRDTTSISRVPVGIGAGYRFALGETRSVSAYASPFFVWSRLSERGARAQSDNAMRGSAAVDLVLTRNIGVTAGYEFGGGNASSSPGGGKGLFGAAVSYAFR
jgi:hypothetical protein